MEREDREPRRHRDNVQPRHSSTNSEEAGEEEQRDTATDPSSDEQRGSRIFAPLALIDDENLDVTTTLDLTSPDVDVAIDDSNSSPTSSPGNPT